MASLKVVNIGIKGVFKINIPFPDVPSSGVCTQEAKRSPDRHRAAASWRPGARVTDRCREVAPRNYTVAHQHQVGWMIVWGDARDVIQDSIPCRYAVLIYNRAKKNRPTSKNTGFETHEGHFVIWTMWCMEYCS